LAPLIRGRSLAARDSHPDDTVLTLGGVCVGGKRIVVMAGPCAIESNDQLKAAARAARAGGATILRGGAFKPRCSPYTL
jgi:3-deoxy-7-phosphoheptulonate synthase